MNDWGIMLLVTGAFVLVLLMLNVMLTKKKKPKKDTRSKREKNLDKISQIKGVK